jgi:hypothetical protein
VDDTLLFDESDRSCRRVALPEEVQTQIPQAKKKVTLREFINENDKLFTAIGVVGALAALFTKVENGELLSFISFVMLLVLDFELWRAFPRSEEASLTMAIFEWLLQGFLFLVAVYLYMTYPLYFRFMVVVAVFSLFALAFIGLDRKFKIYLYFRKAIPDGKWYTAALRGLLGGAIMGLTLLLSFYITNWLYEYLPILFKSTGQLSFWNSFLCFCYFVDFFLLFLVFVASK